MIKNNYITRIHHNCPPCTTEDCGHFCGQGNIVLELPAGTCEELDIRKGDEVDYLF